MPIHTRYHRSIFLADAQATLDLGAEIGCSLAAGDVLLLTGDLGSGKTTFIQGIAKSLGISEQIVSPTFAIINEYLTGKFPLYHLDLYRLDRSEVEDLNINGYWEGIEFEPGIIAIEWPDRLTQFPPAYTSINISYTDGGRMFIIKN
jgi:tRNA threonylcarbamoyladenosine biosynthesis protein TsaE